MYNYETNFLFKKEVKNLKQSQDFLKHFDFAIDFHTKNLKSKIVKIYFILEKKDSGTIRIGSISKLKEQDVTELNEYFNDILSKIMFNEIIKHKFFGFTKRDKYCLEDNTYILKYINNTV